jgi:hypothetical protein
MKHILILGLVGAVIAYTLYFATIAPDRAREALRERAQSIDTQVGRPVYIAGFKSAVVAGLDGERVLVTATDAAGHSTGLHLTPAFVARHLAP